LLDHRFETDAVKALHGFDAAPRHDSGRITQLSRQRQLTLPPLSVSIFPTNSRAAAIGIRNARVQQTSSSRRSSRTRPINAPASSATRPWAQLTSKKNWQQQAEIFSTCAGTGPTVGGAADVRLQRLSYAGERPAFMRCGRTPGRRRHGHPGTQCRSRNAAWWHAGC